jgi:3-oxoacyl-[acyl-carrier-protein] synthase II
MGEDVGAGVGVSLVTPRAVTGIGVVSALGIGRAAFYDAMKSGVVPNYDDSHVETFDASKYFPGPDHAAAKPRTSRRLSVAEVPGFDATKHLGDKGLRSLDRLTKLLIVAARQALHDSGLKKDGGWAAGSADTVGIVVSNAYGSLEAISELDRVATLEDARYINPSRFPLTVSNSAAGYTSIWEEIRAVNVSVSDGNCGALDAAACADVFLDQARARTILVGGAEAMSEALFLAFHKLGALGGGQVSGSEGLCIGEGAALLALEDRKTADARGAHVLAELVGYGTSFVPPAKEYALVHASSEALETAIQNALADARVEPSAIDVVVSGVSGLRAFDEAELLAIRRATREGVTILTPKKSLGETLGAGGAMGMLAAIGVLSSSDGKPGAKTALVTSLGYYGNASAVVMRSATTATR